MGSFQKYLNLSADDKDKLVTKSGLDLTSLTYRNIPRICGTKSGKLVIDCDQIQVIHFDDNGIEVDPLKSFKTNFDVFIESMNHFGFKINDWILITSFHNRISENQVVLDQYWYENKTSMFSIVNENIFPYSKELISELISKNKSKRFLSFNRNNHIWRFFFLLYLVIHDLWDSGLISVHKMVVTQIPHLRKELNLYLETGVEPEEFYLFDKYLGIHTKLPPQTAAVKYLDLLDKLEKYVPCYADIEDITDFTGDLGNNPWSRHHYAIHAVPIDLIKQIFFYVVTDGTFDDEYGQLTEKIPKGLCTIPSMNLGQVGALRRCRELGFKTFPDMFDESYDEIEDCYERFKSVTSQTKYLCTLDYNELHKKYVKSFENVLYNQEILVKCKDNTYREAYDKILNDE